MSLVEVAVLRKRLWSGRVKDLVEQVCVEYPACKGSYGLLLWRVYRKLGVYNLRDFFDKMSGLPSPETIGRRFRELKQERPAEFNPSEATVEKRFNNELVYHEYYGRGIQATLLD